jgi:hypothetical protein
MQYRHIVQEAISTCLDVPNRWILKKNPREEKNVTYVIAEGSRQYPDYDRHGTVSTLKGLDVQGQIIIGGFAYCVCCGEPLLGGNLKCRCEEKVVCQDCESTLPVKDARYHKGVWLCTSCLQMCAACSAIVRDGGGLFLAFNRRGNTVRICESCYSRSISPCGTCSVQTVCPSAQSNRFCQRTAVAA